MVYAALAYSYWAARMDAKAMPTNYTDYSFRLNATELI